MYVYLPDEIKQYEPDLQFFLDLMIRKLHVNRHKGFIEGKSMEFLVSRLRDEVEELKEALDRQSQFDVALECVDVSNQVFLLALACLHKSKDDFKREQKDGHDGPVRTKAP